MKFKALMKDVIVIGHFLAAALTNSYAQHFSAELLQKHIEVLASDSLEGRAPCTDGEQKARDYIVKQLSGLNLLPAGNDGYYQAFTYKQKQGHHDSIGTGKEYCGTNILAYLDRKSSNTIVIGAHYDHLGLDGRGNSLDPNPTGKVHNGADDNASGSAGLIELARVVSQKKLFARFNILFAWFSAEEAGLVGSKFLTNNFIHDIAKVRVMINLDMIGRLNDSTKAITIMGYGTSPVFGKAIEESNKFGFYVIKDSSGQGPSDHTSFYLKDIPVLAFFTGTHTDYHKPTDDVGKINVAGEIKILDFLLSILSKLETYQDIPFSKTKNKQGQAASFKVTLGVMPDYSYSGKGLRIDGVSEGKPASKAGLLAGDVIISINSDVIQDVYGYMKILSKYNKGDKALLTIQRGNEQMRKEVVF